jgi:lysophospholipid acyltransferase (LPLAT)-like uncharacterized protein
MPENPQYSLKQRLILAIGAPAIATFLRLLALSWRTRVIAAPGVLPGESSGPLVYGMWHEGIIAIVGQWRGHRIQGLASQSFDGELISRTLVWLGYPPPARGSSSRGGAGAFSFHLEALREGRHVVVTMDGPRGPRHRCKPGTAQMAERSGRPVVPAVCEARPAFRLRSWDKTLIPWPFAKVVFVLGEPIPVGPGEADTVSAKLPEVMERLSVQAAARLQEF